MTPEHKFTLWTTIFTALPAIVFTGAVAYWTWRRDQERIIVRKSPVYWKTLDGAEGALCGAGIVVTNLSLYPVRIAKLGFIMSGGRTWGFDRDNHDENEWPLEIKSRARMVVYANPREWKQLEALRVPDEIMDWGFVAVAVTETDAGFFSNRLRLKIMRPLRTLRGRLSKQPVG